MSIECHQCNAKVKHFVRELFNIIGILYWSVFLAVTKRVIYEKTQHKHFPEIPQSVKCLFLMSQKNTNTCLALAYSSSQKNINQMRPLG